VVALAREDLRTSQGLTARVCWRLQVKVSIVELASEAVIASHHSHGSKHVHATSRPFDKSVSVIMAGQGPNRFPSLDQSLLDELNSVHSHLSAVTHHLQLVEEAATREREADAESVLSGSAMSSSDGGSVHHMHHIAARRVVSEDIISVGTSRSGSFLGPLGLDGSRMDEGEFEDTRAAAAGGGFSRRRRAAHQKTSKLFGPIDTAASHGATPISHSISLRARIRPSASSSNLSSLQESEGGSPFVELPGRSISTSDLLDRPPPREPRTLHRFCRPVGVGFPVFPPCGSCYCILAFEYRTVWFEERGCTGRIAGVGHVFTRNSLKFSACASSFGLRPCDVSVACDFSVGMPHVP
jgi:hypothetical protein